MGQKPSQDGSDQRRAADDLFRTLEDMINTGVLKEGDPLPPEREIVSTYGVSRTVVREALLAMSNKGLVEARPRYRPIVRRPSYKTAIKTVDNVVGRLLREPDGVANLFETRILIEVALAREAAKRPDDAHIAPLKQALEDNHAAIKDSEAFYQTDMAFHKVLFDLSGNPVLPAIHAAYSTWLAPQWSQMPRRPTRNSRNFAAHERIFEAIQAGSADAAEEAVRAHLHEAWQQVKETFGDL
ncbi:FCD domain-containing protein [Yoonia sp. SS1-5]|uniref:FCD domain-containing protein n=1 Tax=Yoonia rhodophyticola TaxID=3137370 RepID=A0AAN0NJD4_9RHOB